MFGLKARLGITTGVAILATGFAVLPASQALASARSCQNEANGFLEGCANVNGSGLHINYLQGMVTNIGVGDQHMVHLELSGPHGLIKELPDDHRGLPGQRLLHLVAEGERDGGQLLRHRLAVREPQVDRAGEGVRGRAQVAR